MRGAVSALSKHDSHTVYVAHGEPGGTGTGVGGAGVGGAGVALGAHVSVLQKRVSCADPLHAAQPHVAGVCVRDLVCSPPPHGCEHAPNAPNAFHEHARQLLLHASCSRRCGELAAAHEPPPDAGVVTDLVRVRVPVPEQSLLHVVHVDHADSTHGTAGAGVGGLGVGGLGVGGLGVGGTGVGAGVGEGVGGT